MEFNEAFEKISNTNPFEDMKAQEEILALNVLIRNNPVYPAMIRGFTQFALAMGTLDSVISSAMIMGYQMANLLRDNPATDNDGLPSGNTELYFLERLNQLQDPRPHDPGSK